MQNEQSLINNKAPFYKGSMGDASWGVAFGLFVGVLGMLGGCGVGWLYRRYFVNNTLQLLIESRKDRREHKSIHPTRSWSNDGSPSYVAVQLSEHSSPA